MPTRELWRKKTPGQKAPTLIVTAGTRYFVELSVIVVLKNLSSELRSTIAAFSSIPAHQSCLADDVTLIAESTTLRFDACGKVSVVSSAYNLK